MDVMTAYYDNDGIDESCHDREINRLEMKSIILEFYISENPRDIEVKNKTFWLFIRILSILMESYVKINDGKHRVLHRTQKCEYELKEVKNVFKELIEDEILFSKNRDFALQLLENDYIDELFQDNIRSVSKTNIMINRDETNKATILPEENQMQDYIDEIDRNKNKNTIVLEYEQPHSPYCLIRIYRKLVHSLKSGLHKTKKTLYEYIYAC
jgi:hypothetical protein